MTDWIRKTQKLRDFKAEKSRGWNFVSVKIYIARRGDDEQHFIIQFLQAPPFHGKICRHRHRRSDGVEDEENFPARRIWKCLAAISRSPSLIPASFHQAFNFHTRRLASTESRCGDVTSTVMHTLKSPSWKPVVFAFLSIFTFKSV